MSEKFEISELAAIESINKVWKSKYKESMEHFTEYIAAYDEKFGFYVIRLLLERDLVDHSRNNDLIETLYTAASIAAKDIELSASKY